jgi:prephenate dehydrogenase
MNNITIGFIGLGLIGGSIAKAIKNVHGEYNLVAYNHHSSKENITSTGTTNYISPDLEQALKNKTLDMVVTNLNDFAGCDIIILCAPVLQNINYLSLLKDIIKPECILTDVGSVKGNIHNEVIKLGLESMFIGGHPMTGSEKTGYENSHPTLLENAYYILTPTSYTSSKKLEFMIQLVKDMASLPIILDYTKHDEVTAAISHVPHIIAASLVNLVKDSDDTVENMRHLAAGGFKDITRIASSSPTIWQNICLTNTTSIKAFLDNYIASLKNISNALEEKDEVYLYDFFYAANEYRTSIPNRSNGLMQNIYEVFIDIIDEAGAIATIATLLATNIISIKNIGIIHNREFEEGVLRIEFYDNLAREKATSLLKKYSYTIYER